MSEEQEITLWMSELTLSGALTVEGYDDEGTIFSIDWDKLKEADIELYYRFREAEMNAEAEVL